MILLGKKNPVKNSKNIILLYKESKRNSPALKNERKSSIDVNNTVPFNFIIGDNPMYSLITAFYYMGIYIFKKFIKNYFKTNI